MLFAGPAGTVSNCTKCSRHLAIMSSRLTTEVSEQFGSVNVNAHWHTYLGNWVAGFGEVW